MSLEDAAASPAADDKSAVAADTAAPATQDVKSTPADTSTAEGDKAPSMFDAVKASLTKEPEAPPASQAKPDSTDTSAKQPETADEEDDADPGAVSEEEKKLLSAKTQARIGKLVSQRDALKEPAERFRRIEAFQRTTGVSSEEIVNALDILALIRSKPEEALKRVRELSYNLSLQLGETLPKDIQDRVTSGQIDEATGRELARERAKANGFKQVAETSTAERQAQEVQSLKTNISTSVNVWEEGVTKRDPDFAKKKPLVETNFRALLQAGESIKTPEDAVRLMKEAYRRTNEQLGATRTAKPEVKPTPATAASAAVAAPKTHDEAIRQALGAPRPKRLVRI
jgi:hypothetical protein